VQLFNMAMDVTNDVVAGHFRAFYTMCLPAHSNQRGFALKAPARGQGTRVIGRMALESIR
jgi:hypothetical protein